MADHSIFQNQLLTLISNFKSAEKGAFLNLTIQYLGDTENEEKAHELLDLVRNSPSLKKDFQKNFGGPETSPAEESLGSPEVYEPKNTPGGLTELKKKMNKAHFIKAVGAGKAFTDIKKSKQLQVNMKNFNQVRDIDQSWLQDAVLTNPLYRNQSNAKLYLKEIGAGATIQQITEKLERDNLALMNQPGYEELTYLGVAMVGGHGSGLNLHPLADYIVSMNVLVFENGKAVEKRIEDTNGITRKDVYQQKTGIEVINDDEVMNAFRVSVGALGIVLSYVVQVQDFFYLKETRVFRSWDSLKSANEIDTLLSDPKIHSLHLWFNPYSIKKNGEPTKKVWCLVSKYELAEPGTPSEGLRGTGVQLENIKGLGHFLIFALEFMPYILPRILDSSLNTCINKNGHVVLPCYQALNFGTPNDADVDPTNCGIPYNSFKTAADDLFTFLENNRKEHPVTSPIGFRFTAAGKGLLGAQKDQPTCMIELPLLSVKMGHIKEKNATTLNMFNEKMMGKYKGKPHWGQYTNEFKLNTAHEDIYGENYSQFKKVYQKYGKNKFSNYFTELMKLDN